MLKLQRDLTQHYDHVWTSDPAIDKEHANFDADEYLKTGDMKFAPLRDGEKPTVFKIAPLSRKQWLDVTSRDGLTERLDAAVSYGLRSVENLEINGSPFQLEHEQSSKGSRVKQAYLDQIWDPELMTEIGAKVIQISKIDPLS
jgi:hypothetical protein